MAETTIGITSFLRFGYLQEAIWGLRRSFEGFNVLVADDSDNESHPILGTGLIKLSFDSGLCAKRNALLEETKTEYFLLGSDDFIFDDEARAGVETLTSILNVFPEIDVVAGRVNNRPYEGFIKKTQDEIREVSLNLDRDDIPVQADLTANYFLGRTKRLLPWRGNFKIGGEHIVWFLDMKEAGRKIYWVPSVNINTQAYDPAKQDPRYNSFRARATQGHKEMKQLLGIDRYYDFNGAIS